MDKKRKRILVVGAWSNLFSNALKSLETTYDVSQFKYVRTSAFKLEREQYDFIVIEASMPTASFYSKQETEEDTRSGIVFYKREVKKLKLPALLISGQEDLEKEIEAMKDPKLKFVLETTDEKFILNAVNEFFANE